MPVEYSRSAYDLHNEAFSHHVEYHLDVESSDVYKSSLLILRHQLHEASKEHCDGTRYMLAALLVSG